MIDTVFNLLFRCQHRRITRPVTPVSKPGMPHGDSYVVCLDCGKQFAYDLEQMRIGKPVASSQNSGVLPVDMPKPRKSKVRLALWASALPLAWMLGAAMKGNKNSGTPPAGKPEEKDSEAAKKR